MKADSKYIWDYDIKSIDFDKPAQLRWYLARKINFGDWKGLDTSLVEKHLDKLDIDPALKKMLKDYYADKRAKNRS